MIQAQGSINTEKAQGQLLPLPRQESTDPSKHPCKSLVLIMKKRLAVQKHWYQAELRNCSVLLYFVGHVTTVLLSGARSVEW